MGIIFVLALFFGGISEAAGEEVVSLPADHDIAFGYSVSTIDGSFEYALYDATDRTVLAHHEGVAPKARLILPVGYYQETAFFSPSQQAILFLSEQEVIVTDLSLSEQRRIGICDDRCVVERGVYEPNSDTFFAIVSLSNAAVTDANPSPTALIAINMTTGKKRQLGRFGTTSIVSLSSGGNSVRVMTPRIHANDDYQHVTLLEVDVRRRNSRKRKKTVAFSWRPTVWSSGVSPRSDTVLISGLNSIEDYSVSTVSFKGGKPISIYSELPSAEIRPLWSGDGKEILLEKRVASDAQVAHLIVSLDTGEREPLPALFGNVLYFAPSKHNMLLRQLEAISIASSGETDGVQTVLTYDPTQRYASGYWVTVER